MAPRQRGPWSTLATPQRASQLEAIAKSINATSQKSSTSSTKFESGLAVAALLIAAVLLNYLGGATSSLLSKIIGTWASESLRYLLLTLASTGALYGWHKRSKGGEAAAVWAATALFAVLSRQLLAASAAIFLNKGSEYISTTHDIEILTRWALTTLFGCGGIFFLLGWALGNALYAMPAALYAPGLFSIPLIIAAPSLAVAYPYYHQCIALPLVSILSALLATAYLYTIPSSSGAVSASAVRNQASSVQKWRIQAQLLCLFLLFTSFRTISDCLYCGTTTSGNSRTAKNHKRSSFSNPRTGCVWRCALHDGSFLSIIENSPEDNPILRYKVMRLNHAIMGGIWILPEREAGRPVYTAFHLQAASRLLLSDDVNEEKNGENNNRQQGRSLHVGLGAGTAVSVLQQRGYRTDVVELYTEIIDAAQTHFGLKINRNNTATNRTTNSNDSDGSSSGGGTAYAGDALKVIPTLEDSIYDLVILDVFSGGFPTSTDTSFLSSFFYPSKRGQEDKEKEESSVSRQLSSAAFFREIKQKMRHGIGNGVLAVNYVGMQDSPELAQLVCTLKQVFTSVRYFKDTEGEEDDDDGEVEEEGDKGKRRKKDVDSLGNYVIMAIDNNSNTGSTSDSTGATSKAGVGGGSASDLFSAAQKEILNLGDGPLDEMEVDVLSRLAKSELPVAWATQETCERILRGGSGGDGNRKKGAVQRSHKALAGLKDAAEHWRTMRVQFGDEVWTL